MPALVVALLAISRPLLLNLLRRVLTHPRFIQSAAGQSILKFLEFSGYVAAGTLASLTAWVASAVSSSESTTAPEIIFEAGDKMLDDVQVVADILSVGNDVGLALWNLFSDKEAKSKQGREMISELKKHSNVVLTAVQNSVNQLAREKSTANVLLGRMNPSRSRGRSLSLNLDNEVLEIVRPVAASSQTLTLLDLNIGSHRDAARDIVRWAISHYGGIRNMKKAHLLSQAFMELSEDQVNTIVEEFI